MLKCPDRKSFEEWLWSPHSASSQLSEHVRGCSTCQQHLEQIVRDPELEAWRQALANQPHRLNSPLCLELVEQFQFGHTHPSHDSQTATPQDSNRTFKLETKPGTEVGHYRLVKELGRGGMSIVFEAIDLRIQRLVALKLLQGERRQQHAETRFLRECIAVTSVRHPNVVAVYDADPSPITPYLAMELVRGETLREWIASQVVPNVRQSAELISKVADGLQAAHNAGILHRDIKPGNILLSSPNPTDAVEVGQRTIEPKLADFGLARPLQTDGQLTASGYLAGTPAYASPEQILTPERLDQTSDIYSLGATLYESLTGVTPYRGSAQAVIQQIIEGELVAPRRLNNSIPHDLETICLMAMNHDAKLRYATAADFGGDLRRWLDGRTIKARPASSWEKTWRWTVRNRGIAALASAVVGLSVMLAIGSTSMWLILRSKNSQLVEEIRKTQVANEDSRKSTEIAFQQRALALDSLNELTSEVQAQLSSSPGLLKLREDILRTALRGLERVTESTDRDQLEHVTIAAHLQMARVLRSMREVAKSKEHIDKAVELSQRALAAQPGDIEYIRDLANSFALNAEFYGAVAGQQRETFLLKELELRKALVAQEPNVLKTNLTMIGTIQQLADLKKYQMNFAQALNGFEEARGLLETLSKTFPENRELMLERCINHNRLGSVLSKLNRFAEADSHLQSSLTLCDELVALDPGHIRYQETIAYILQTLARRRLAARDLEPALSFAQRANQQYQKLAAIDQSNVNAQSLAGTGSYLLYEVLIAMGRIDEARGAAEVSAIVTEKLAHQHPDAVADFLLAAQAWNAVSDAHLRLGQNAAALEAQHRTVSLYREAERAKDYSPTPWKYVLDVSIELEDAIRLSGQGESEIRSKSQATPGVCRLALVLLFYEAARQMQLEEAIKLGNELTSTKPEKQGLYPLVYSSRAHALILAKLRENSENEDQQGQISQTKAQLIASIKDLLSLGGTRERLVDVDFVSLEHDDEFKAITEATADQLGR